MSEVCIHKCINKFQETKAVPGCHTDIVTANKTYKVRKAIRIVEES